jgi:hypothetical protein
MEMSQNDWKITFLLPMMKAKVDECLVAGKKPEYRDASESNFRILNFHFRELGETSGFKPGKWMSSLNYSGFNDIAGDDAKLYLDSLKVLFRTRNRIISAQRDSLLKIIADRIGGDKFLLLRERDYNESLANIVLNRLTTNKIYETDNKLIQKADPIYMPPGSRYGRAHFYAPYKLIGNLRIGTMVFNMIIVWLMIVIFFITLYYNVLKRLILWLERLKLPFWRKFGRELLQI